MLPLGESFVSLPRLVRVFLREAVRSFIKFCSQLQELFVALLLLVELFDFYVSLSEPSLRNIVLVNGSGVSLKDLLVPHRELSFNILEHLTFVSELVSHLIEGALDDARGNRLHSIHANHRALAPGRLHAVLTDRLTCI